MEGKSASAKTISQGLSRPRGLFVDIFGHIFVDNGIINSRVDRWIFNESNGSTVMNVSTICYSLFVDVNETLYCSMGTIHLVVKQSLSNTNGSLPITAAGNMSAGSSLMMLNTPCGIFVDLNLDLYVADCLNHRIQRFLVNQLQGTTVAGAGAVKSASLSYPSAVMMDGNGYLFIADSNNNRILRSGTQGVRCIVGCTAIAGSALDQLNNPWSLSFDTHGNLFVTDRGNDRVQKFILASNSCTKGQSTLRVIAVIHRICVLLKNRPTMNRSSVHAPHGIPRRVPWPIPIL